MRYIVQTIILLFVLVSLSSCVTSGLKTRAVASDGCNIENYQDYINKLGFHNCDLRGANLQGADLDRANLSFSDLRGANLAKASLVDAILAGTNLRYANLQGVNIKGAKVSLANAHYLRSKGLSGFVIIEWMLGEPFNYIDPPEARRILKKFSDFTSYLIEEGKVNIKSSDKFSYSPHVQPGQRPEAVLNRPEFYPYGVCMEENNISEAQRELLRKGMNIWNAKYDDYYKGLSDIKGIMKSPLFVESCDHENHFVIQAKFVDLGFYTFGGILSETCPFSFYKTDCFEGDWLGILMINSKIEKLEKKKQVIIVVHEFGHFLGFPDPPFITAQQSKIMSYCDLFNIKPEDCNLEDSDFDFMINLHKNIFRS